MLRITSWTISSGASKPKGGRVADVELDDALAFFLHLARARHHRPADVVADAFQLAGFLHGPQHRRPCIIHGIFPEIALKIRAQRGMILLDPD
jgi:hypothetical protein